MKRRLWRACAIAVGLLGLNCTDSTGPRNFAGRLAFAPSFERSSAGVVDFDRIRITLVHATAPNAQVLDTIIAIPATADSIDLSLSVPLASSREDMLLYLRLINAAGDTVFQNTPYPQPVTVTSGGTPALVPAPIQYVGVGHDAVAVVIGTPDTSVLFGDTLRLTATALGPQANPIPGTPIAWRSLDSLRVRVPAAGVAKVVGGSQRGPARIVAELLTGPADTVIVTAQPLPATLSKISGDNQSAPPLAVLPQPLRVRVLGSDGLPVQAPVVFRALTAGASVSADTVRSDSTGYAEVVATLGGAVGQQDFDARVNGLSVAFKATAVSGSVASVTLDRTVDTIARGTGLQYNAVARDAQGNPVSVTIGWNSTVSAVASVNSTGLVAAVAPGFTQIIASAAGHADTAALYVRALDSVAVSPSDTVITAIGDSFDLHATAYDNFGTVLTAGFTRKFLSATPTVVTVNQATGRTTAVGAGNGVVVVKDSVSGYPAVQAAATVRVNQVTASIRNTPGRPDTLEVGVNGRRAIIAQALDRNNHTIPNKAFGFRSAAPAVATVDNAGIVTGLQLNGMTFVIDSVDGFKDSVFVAVVPAPPALLQWGADSLSVGNGGSLSVPLTLSRTDPGTTRVLLSVIPATDTIIARPALGCPGGVLTKISIAPGAAGTSVLFCGLKAGRVTVVAADSAGVFAPDTMIVTVVSTIEFRDVGSFSQQSYFYANQNETYRAQIFLSDPAPAGGLGVTFVYGKPGTSAITPAPAIVPAGQLAADVVIQGLAPGIDSVVPTSGGFVGKFSRVYVAPNNLTLNIPYPYTRTLGVGQTFQPYVSITYGMDHILVVNASLGSGLGTIQSPDTIKKSATGAYFTVTANATGKTSVTVAASGWVSAADTLIFTTPQLVVSGQTSLIAGNPTLGYWSAYPADSLRAQHQIAAPLVVTALSRSPSVVSVDSATLNLPAGSSGNTRYNSLRAQPSAGGDSAWIVLSAPGYRPDSLLVHVTKPTMTAGIAYPYTGRLGVGTLWKNAGYVQLPYARPDTFTVSFTHSHQGAVRGPTSVRFIPPQTTVYFDLVGDSVGVADTIRVDTTLTPGYVITGTPLVYRVDSLHVRPYQYPGPTNYTIGSPYPVTVMIYDSVDNTSRELIAPLRVNLVSTNTATFTLDSAAVTIDSGQYYSYNHPDTLRFRGVDSGGARIVATATGLRSDSSNLIKVFPTPLTVQLGYPYTIGRGLKLKNNYVYVSGGNVPDTVKVALTRFDPTVDTLTADTVKILKGQGTSQSFAIWALDSLRSDSIVATATGYVRGKVSITPEAVSLLQGGLPATRLTTDPPYRAYVGTGTRSGWSFNPIVPVNVTVVSTDPNVMLIDSAFTVNATGDTAIAVVDTSTYYVNTRVRFVGNGTARLRYSAAGFRGDSTPLVTVTGPVLHLTTGNQTLGIGQLLPNQYVYVDNPVTGSPLVVHLLRSDSTQPAANQVFQLSADSVIIPVGQQSSNYFDIAGNFNNSAVLTARATAYSQSIATISVGTPQLVAPTNVTVFVGQQPPSYGVYTADQNSQSRIVASALVVSGNSTDPAVAQVDSATATVPARASYAYFPIRGLSKGAVNIVFSAPGYKPDTTVVSVDTGQVSFGAVPTALGVNQSTQMYVTLPFTNDAAVTVALTSSDPAVLTVPASVVIPARSGYVYFDVTGQGTGGATVTGTAAIAKSGTSSAIAVGTPRLFVSLNSTGVVGQRFTFNVYTQDQAGNNRVVTAPVSVTLSSSAPAHATFDNTTVTVVNGTANVGAGVVFDTAGTYTITAAANGYASGSGNTTMSGALVTIGDLFFAPQTVTIKQNQYVTWKNTGPSTHTSTSDTPGWNTGNLLPGQTSSATYFGTVGTFTYHCTIHPSMTGTVIVQP